MLISPLSSSERSLNTGKLSGLQYWTHVFQNFPFHLKTQILSLATATLFLDKTASFHLLLRKHLNSSGVSARSVLYRTEFPGRGLVGHSSPTGAPLRQLPPLRVQHSEHDPPVPSPATFEGQALRGRALIELMPPVLLQGHCSVKLASFKHSSERVAAGAAARFGCGGTQPSAHLCLGTLHQCLGGTKLNDGSALL